jgi:hypothetical protein
MLISRPTSTEDVMADDRTGARGGYGSNSPYGDEDSDRQPGRTERGFFGRTGNELRSWFGFGDDDPQGGYGRGTQSWGQANEGGNWGSGRREPDRSHYGPEHGFGGFQGDYGGGSGQGGFGGRGDWEGGRQSFSGSRNFGPEDQHYLSWRDRQIAELDRDYEEYCREHGRDFHSSFDSWRRNRRSGEGSGEPTSGASGSTGSSAATPESSSPKG